MRYNLIIIFFLFAIDVLSMNDNIGVIGKKRDFKSLLFVTSGLPFSTGSPDFFKIYDSEFKGFKKDFKLFPIIGGGTKLRFDGNYRLGAQFILMQSTLQDFYEEEVRTIDVTGYRNIGQTINITDIPIIATAEYLPYTSQFRTYVGGGAGFMLRNVEWKELIRSSIPLDYRVSGEHYSDMEIHPCFKVYSGVELGFDKMSEMTFLGSLVIEASFNYNLSQTNLFRTVKRQFVPESKVLEGTVNLIPGYFILSIAVTFNFNK